MLIKDPEQSESEDEIDESDLEDYMINIEQNLTDKAKLKPVHTTFKANARGTGTLLQDDDIGHWQRTY